MKKKTSIIGAVTVVIILVAIALVIKYFYKPAVSPSPNEIKAGIVDINQVLKIHPQYRELVDLRNERVKIIEKITALSKETKTGTDDAAAVESINGIFNGFAQQKDDMRQRIVKQKLQDDMLDREKQLRAAVANSRAVDIKSVSNEYENAIFNCSLKLDNAENLRLSDDDINNLNEQMFQLKKERAEKIHAVMAKYESQISAQLSEYFAERIAALQADADNKNEKNNQEISAQANEFQKQKDELSQKKQDMLNSRKKLYFNLFNQLDEKNKEIDALQKAMIQDIAAKAAKIAIVRHLDIVYANQQGISDEEIGTDEIFDKYFENNIITTSSVQNITADVMQEMQDGH
ncbi:hypothetical protein [Pectinatus frisingensis]|jgi:hypothetical protein|uniref:hypothetical protein n=1 Tax=Pectinatus frisingensis TaxID=865 RepID=UPI0015F742DE|nr:hypothetical protein [Pectinatus frisingensis]